MNSIVARQFIVSRLTPKQFRHLHEMEEHYGCHFAPCEIHSRARLSAMGSVPEDFQRQVAPRVMAIHDKMTKQAYEDAQRDGSDVSDLSILHDTDKEVKRQEIDFNFKGRATAGSIMDEVSRVTEQAPY